MAAYVNTSKLNEALDSCDKQEGYFRGKIHDDSVVIASYKGVVDSKEAVINSHEEVKKGLEREVKNKRNGKTLWQCISAGLGGLLLYKEFKP